MGKGGANRRHFRVNGQSPPSPFGALQPAFNYRFRKDGTCSSVASYLWALGLSITPVRHCWLLPSLADFHWASRIPLMALPVGCVSCVAFLALSHAPFHGSLGTTKHNLWDLAPT